MSRSHFSPSAQTLSSSQNAPRVMTHSRGAAHGEESEQIAPRLGAVDPVDVSGFSAAGFSAAGFSAAGFSAAGGADGLEQAVKPKSRQIKTIGSRGGRLMMNTFSVGW